MTEYWPRVAFCTTRLWSKLDGCDGGNQFVEAVFGSGGADVFVPEGELVERDVYGLKILESHGLFCPFR